MRRLDSFGIGCEIVDATDGGDLDLSTLRGRLRQDKAEKIYGYALRPGEIGCYLSHYRLWEKMARENISQALILEDDAEFAPDFFAAVSEIISCEWEWEFVNLSAIRPPKIRKTLRRVGDNRKFGLSSRSGSTLAAYLLTLSGAKKLISYCREIRAPIDYLCVQWWRHKAAFYYVSPPPAVQTKEDESGTGVARVNRALLPSLHRKRERLARFWAVQFHRPKKKK